MLRSALRSMLCWSRLKTLVTIMPSLHESEAAVTPAEPAASQPGVSTWGRTSFPSKRIESQSISRHPGVGVSANSTFFGERSPKTTPCACIQSRDRARSTSSSRRVRSSTSRQIFWV